MRTAALLLASTLSLAACSSEPTVTAENASVEDVAKKVNEARGSGSFMSPGKWESKVAIEEISIPGMPPEAAEKMKSMGGHEQSVQTCLTAKDVEKPAEKMFAGGNQNCRYETFSMGGGKINAVMKCNAAGGAQVMQMAGTYNANSYNMAVSSTANGPGGQNMKMRMRLDAKRLGACDGTEAKS